MSPKAKLVLGAVISAAVNALVLFLKPEIQPAALALAGFVLGALGFKRPGDVGPADVEAAGGSDGYPLATVEGGKVVLK